MLGYYMLPCKYESVGAKFALPGRHSATTCTPLRRTSSSGESWYLQFTQGAESEFHRCKYSAKLTLLSSSSMVCNTFNTSTQRAASSLVDACGTTRSKAGFVLQSGASGVSFLTPGRRPFYRNRKLRVRAGQGLLALSSKTKPQQGILPQVSIHCQALFEQRPNPDKLKVDLLPLWWNV